MDDIVKQAMAKWPSVPDCYAWLGLDARGNWYMRDDRAQQLGTFQSPGLLAKGSRLQHAKLIDFIQRNYEADDAGQWYFQNGPQRVYVELACTPHIWRVAEDFSVASHTGAIAQVRSAVVDENGWLYLHCALSDRLVLGLVHTQDVLPASLAIENGLWTLIERESTSLPADYGYVISPQDRLASGRATVRT
jgi:Protein of unknown function (DUF2946)